MGRRHYLRAMSGAATSQMSWSGVQIIVGDVLLRALTPHEVDALVASATEPGAVLAPAQDYFDTWLSSPAKTEARVRAAVCSPQVPALGPQRPHTLGIFSRG